MVDLAISEIRILEDLDFDNIVVSVKAFEVPVMIAAYRRLAKAVPYPLHLGVTEAGTALSGSIRSAAGMSVLLYEGIGDTIRVSLSEDPVVEVKAAFDLLKSLGLRDQGLTLVACPSCGRADIDLIPLAKVAEERLRALPVPMKVAVMGCEVNGPGEAKDADVGIAGGVGKGAIFRKGKFDGADLRQISPEGTRFEKCSFDDARLDGWTPARAEFVECRFAGKVLSVTFTGRPAGPGSTRIDPVRSRNEFRGNDFRDAQLIDTVFVFGVDLDPQRWPVGDDYVRLDKFHRRTEAARAEILGWETGEMRPAGLA